MKKLFITSTLLLSICKMAIAASFSNNVASEPEGPTLVIIHTVVSGSNSEHDEASRAPVRVPSLYIEDHTLSFSSSCVGYTLQLVQDDVVVYTYYIQDSDDLDLPSNQTGEYEIRLVGETFTFVGKIEL